MRRTQFLLLFFIILIVLSGCEKIEYNIVEKEVTQENNKMQESLESHEADIKKVPFLYYTYSEDGQRIIAKHAQWDLSMSSITLTEEEVYSIDINENFSAPNFLKYEEQIEKWNVISNYTDSNCTVYYGRNIIAEKEYITNDSGKIEYLETNTYDLQVTDGIKLESINMQYLIEGLSTVNNIGDEPAFIDYNKETQKITFLFYIREKFIMNSLFVATIDLNNGSEVEWREIKLSEDKVRMGKSLTPTPSNSFLLDNIYYVENSLDPVAINIETGEVLSLEYISKATKDLQTKYLGQVIKGLIECFGGHTPYGFYGDITIYRERLLTGNSNYIYMAYQSGIYMGALHILNDGTCVIDEEFHITESVDISDKNTCWVLIDGMGMEIIDNENKEEFYKAFGSDYIYFPMYGERYTKYNQSYNKEYLNISKE